MKRDGKPLFTLTFDPSPNSRARDFDFSRWQGGDAVPKHEAPRSPVKTRVHAPMSVRFQSRATFFLVRRVPSSPKKNWRSKIKKPPEIAAKAAQRNCA